MAGKQLEAMITLAGKVDGSLKKAVDSAQSKISGLKKSLDENKAFGVAKAVGSGAAKAAKAVGTAALAATAAATTAAVAIGKQSFDAYADYEQLVGGVDTLFGSASGKLQGYAADAYKTAGMSANQYMEQATSFSAALVSGLKQDGRSMEETYSMAADAANMAMTDMADNSNKFGTSMADIQNAYQGFAKQNYTICLKSAA